MGTLFGIMVILFGGSSGGGQTSMLNSICTGLAVILYIALLYVYWAAVALGLMWACDAVGLDHAYSTFIILLGPIAIPMVLIEALGKN